MIFSLFGGDKKRISQMINAARTGDTESIKQLLLQGADINAPEPSTGDTPLIASIDKEQWDTVNYLLEQGPDLSLEDKNGNTPLYLAVSRVLKSIRRGTLTRKRESSEQLVHWFSKFMGSRGIVLILRSLTRCNGILQSNQQSRQ